MCDIVGIQEAYADTDQKEIEKSQMRDVARKDYVSRVERESGPLTSEEIEEGRGLLAD